MATLMKGLEPLHSKKMLELQNKSFIKEKFVERAECHDFEPRITIKVS